MAHLETAEVLVFNLKKWVVFKLKPEGLDIDELEFELIDHGTGRNG